MYRQGMGKGHGVLGHHSTQVVLGHRAASPAPCWGGGPVLLFPCLPRGGKSRDTEPALPGHTAELGPPGGLATLWLRGKPGTGAPQPWNFTNLFRALLHTWGSARTQGIWLLCPHSPLFPLSPALKKIPPQTPNPLTTCFCKHFLSSWSLIWEDAFVSAQPRHTLPLGQ